MDVLTAWLWILCNSSFFTHAYWGCTRVITSPSIWMTVWIAISCTPTSQIFRMLTSSSPLRRSGDRPFSISSRPKSFLHSFPVLFSRALNMPLIWSDIDLIRWSIIKSASSASESPLVSAFASKLFIAPLAVSRILWKELKLPSLISSRFKANPRAASFIPYFWAMSTSAWRGFGILRPVISALMIVLTSRFIRSWAMVEICSLILFIMSCLL